MSGEDVRALARETLRRYTHDGTLAAEGEEPNEVVFAREVLRLSAEVEELQRLLGECSCDDPGCPSHGDDPATLVVDAEDT